MLIDTHCHLNFKAFKDDADEVIRRTLDQNVWMVLVGVEAVTSRRALDLVRKYEKGVYASVGLHPIHLEKIETSEDDYSFTTRGEDFNYEFYENLARLPGVVAIGETGLDYYHIDREGDVAAIRQKQQTVFLEHLKLARALDLPVVIHSRDAREDTLRLIKEFRKEYKDELPDGRPWGVAHCFTGTEDLAWEYFGAGLLVSFTGLITFNRGWDNLIRKLPLDKFLVETDSPFMTPAPFRGERNEPSNVKLVAQRIAEIKGLSLDKIAEISTNNARRLFKI